jgi:hypothetical protein
MKNLINKATSLMSGAALFAFGVVMAGIGLATISVLALLALTAVGMALLAAPFAAMAQTSEVDADDTLDATADKTVDAAPAA